MSPLSRRRALSLLALGAGAGTVTGCATLPTSGEVNASDVVAADDGTLVQTAAGPVDGASPEQVVQGFLRACEAGFSDAFATARSFLDGPVARSWEPLSCVRVYSGSGTRVVGTGPDGAVRVTVEQIASLDAVGVLTGEPGSQTSLSYSLATSASGAWRIVDMPAGTVLPSSVLTDNLVARSLYFLAPDEQRLVPDLRWVPQRNEHDAMVRALVAGPSSWLAAGVSTVVPDGTALGGSVVSLSERTAVVTLPTTLADLSATQRGLLVSQVSTTLLQSPEVEGVVVRAGSITLGEPAALLPVSSSPGAAVGMSRGAVVRGTSSTRSTLVTAQVLGTPSASRPALGADGTVYVLSGPSLLRVGPGEQAATVVLSVGPADATAAGALLPPVVDRHGWVWTAASGRLLAVNKDGVRGDPAGAWLEGGAVVALDLSAESARIALRVSKDGQEHVYAAVVVRDGSGQPTALGEPIELQEATSGGTSGLSWHDLVTVAVLAAPDQPDGTPVVRRVQVPGTSASADAARGAVSLTADRVDGDVLLTDASHQVWGQDGTSWRVVSTEVGDVSYPLQ